MNNHHKEINYAFIDSQNLNLGVKSQGWILDFKKFRVYLNDQFNISKAFLFLGYIAGNERLYSKLQLFGYTLIFKPTSDIKSKGKRFVKGNVDGELILHAVVESQNYDKAIIVSGDGDFHCLIEYLEKEGKLLKIIVPNKSYSSLLRKFSEYILPMELIRNKVKK